MSVRNLSASLSLAPERRPTPAAARTDIGGRPWRSWSLRRRA